LPYPSLFDPLFGVATVADIDLPIDVEIDLDVTAAPKDRP
jgi:hypothetical protein